VVGAVDPRSLRLGSVLGEWPISSIAKGEAQIAAALRSIGELLPEGIQTDVQAKASRSGPIPL
jgi:hypothetical protein